MVTNHTSQQVLLQVVIPKETCDYRIVTDDAENWHIVANRPLSPGERIITQGSSLHLHVGSAAGIEVILKGTGEKKYVSTAQHAVPGDASCVPSILEFPWCLMNHSCEPNSHDQRKPSVSGNSTSAPPLFATQPIALSEEITYDYTLEQFDYRSPFQCRCGSTSCRGSIRGFNGLSDAEQSQSLRRASSYVRDRFHRESVLKKGITFEPLGQHLVADYWDCDPALLDDREELTRLLQRAATAAGAKVISTQAHRFDNQGVTAIALLAESHISIHTWPDRRYAGVDIYTCGKCNPYKSHQVLADALTVGRVELLDITRGKADAPPSITPDSVEPPLRSGLERDKAWFLEGCVPGRRHGSVNHGFHISKVVHQERTQFQECLIFDNPVYGRVLILDGIVQLSTYDEHIYHEMLVHPPMFAHPQPRRVAIVGGGDGGTLREVLRHNPQEVMMIDIDEQFVRMAEKHLPSLSAGAFTDERVTLLFEDARSALERYQNDFDVVIIDCNGAVGPSEPLFEEPFYAQVARALRPDGTCSVQAGSTLDPEFLQKVRQRMADQLGSTTGFRFTIPSYHCGEYLFFVASRDQQPTGPELKVLTELQATRNIVAKYWSPAIHHASQALPTNVTP